MPCVGWWAPFEMIIWLFLDFPCILFNISHVSRHILIIWPHSYRVYDVKVWKFMAPAQPSASAAAGPPKLAMIYARAQITIIPPFMVTSILTTPILNEILISATNPILMTAWSTQRDILLVNTFYFLLKFSPVACRYFVLITRNKCRVNVWSLVRFFAFSCKLMLYIKRFSFFLPMSIRV